jgi:hypothetical protein
LLPALQKEERKNPSPAILTIKFNLIMAAPIKAAAPKPANQHSPQSPQVTATITASPNLCRIT